ncbi:putative anion transporter 2, chloroplastic [Triticum urartu]|uniref:Putative anion transporter 2, chloroplastic n=1 Tax=Triticum urartu TaxID=4572 RepID=M8A9Y2_TRIUA|nr:putative anion transporter 2, chloroplastic [Triticum urartu]
MASVRSCVSVKPAAGPARSFGGPIRGEEEGVAFPTMSTFLPKWFPTHERATAVGLSMGGFHLGNVVSFLATPIIMSHIGLAGTFAFFASLGYLWLSVWLLNVESDPIDSRAISKSELQLILAGRSKSKVKGSKSPSLREVFSKMEMWAIIVANVINNWGYFVLLSWMPVYFKTVYNVNLKQAAWFSAIPWGVMALSGYVAGASADFMIKSGLSIVRIRKIMQSIGFIGPAVIMTAALGLSSCSQAGYFCNVQEGVVRKGFIFTVGHIHSVYNSGSSHCSTFPCLLLIYRSCHDALCYLKTTDDNSYDRNPSQESLLLVRMPAIRVGILLGIKDATFEVGSMDIGEFYVSMEVFERALNFKWEIVVVYGPADHHRSEAFLDELLRKVSAAQLLVVVGGDFNLIG